VVWAQDSQAVTNAWAEWVAGLGEWHIFGGLTYDQRRSRAPGLQAPGVRPGADVVKRHALAWLKEAPKSVGRPVEAAVVALEYQKNGWPHLHPLLRLAGGVRDGDIAALGRLWFDAHGGNRLEVPRSRSDVCAYAAKYLVKDLARGDVLLFPLRGPLTTHQRGFA
jgi:hypothetical protein